LAEVKKDEAQVYGLEKSWGNKDKGASNTNVGKEAGQLAVIVKWKENLAPTVAVLQTGGKIQRVISGNSRKGGKGKIFRLLRKNGRNRLVVECYWWGRSVSERN